VAAALYSGGGEWIESGVPGRGIEARIGGLAGGSVRWPHGVTCGAAMEGDPAAGTDAAEAEGVERHSLPCRVGHCGPAIVGLARRTVPLFIYSKKIHIDLN
jgi:hypothetical protein